MNLKGLLNIIVLIKIGNEEKSNDCEKYGKS